MIASISIAPDATLRLQEDLAGQILRIAFTTGCGGSGYRLVTAGAPEDDDIVLNIGNITVALDSMAASQLDGAIIRLAEDDEGYYLEHPNAVMSVWCG